MTEALPAPSHELHNVEAIERTPREIIVAYATGALVVETERQLIRQTIEVPTLEETAASYHRVVEEWGVPVPEGSSLGIMLAQSAPPAQHMLRRSAGLFPFAEPQSDASLATLFGISQYEAGRRVRSCKKTLNENIHPPAKGKNLRKHMPLEMIARLLNENVDTIDNEKQALVRAIYGLPPFTMPMPTTELARLYNIKRQVLTYREDAILSNTIRVGASPPPKPRPTPRRAFTLSSGKKFFDKKIGLLSPDQQQQYFEARDMGVYAEILLGLHNPEAKEETIAALRASLQRLTGRRKGVRKGIEKNPKPLNGVQPMPYQEQDNPAFDKIEAAARLLQKRAYNPRLETKDGHETIIAGLAATAETLDTDATEYLEQLQAEGDEAVEMLINQNIMLCYYVTIKAPPKSSRAMPWLQLLSVAYMELTRTVHKFDPSLGYQFSSLATKNMYGCLLRESRKEFAQRLGVPSRELETIFRVRNARDTLTEQLADSKPTDAQLSRLTGLSLADISYYSRFGEEAFIHPSTRSLADPAYSQNAKLQLHETLGAEAYFQAEHEAAVNEERREALATALTSAGINPDEEKVLFGLFGLEPYPHALTEQQVSQHLGISEKLVRSRFSTASRKLVRSDEARAALARFIPH